MPTKLNFYQRAEKLGHSIERLKAGETIWSTITISDIDTLKLFLDEGLTPAECEKLAEELFGNIPVTDPEKDASAGGILRRVEGFLYGSMPLSDLDRERTKSLFPVTIDAISAQDPPPINTPQNLGTGGTMAYVNYQTMTLENGGYFIIYNKPLTFAVDTLIRNGGGAGQFFDINIFGATGGAGNPGSVGGTGGKGGDGSNGTCSSPGIAGNSGGPGNTGTSGSTGSAGFTGLDGAPSMLANITITTSITGTAPVLTVATRSGTGGAGGPGGTGGVGGQGGKGGDGATCGCEGTNGGNGAPGGRGGVGGTGGAGGNGVDAAANITVTVPIGQLANAVGFTSTAPFGVGGTGGTGGVGGTGGAGGGGGGASGCPGHSGGSGSGQGGSGARGGNGLNGTIKGNPALIIIQQA